MVCIPFLLVFPVLINVSLSLRFVSHPEANLNFKQKVKKHGYPLESHEVTTEDNYILTIHRVPYGRRRINNSTNKRSPVLIVHGMAGRPEYFFVLGRRSLVYYLADRGFDVWIFNARGSDYSQKHKYFDLEKDNRYWMFSYHEIGVYDIPANIDYIVNKTNQKVFVIGHSQGNTCYAVMASERPEYNEKVKIGIFYAPAIILHVDNPVIMIVCHIVEIFEIIYNFLGISEFLPITKSVHLIIKALCIETTYFMQLCIDVLSSIGTHESKLLTKETAALIFSIPPTRISARQIFHYMQNIKSGIFRQYDYGENDNLRRYKTKTPPLYNLTKAVAPAAIFYGEKDDYTTVQGAQETMEALPNVIFGYKIPHKYFNHIDFIFGTNASFLVYKPTAKLLKDFDNGKFSEKKMGK